MMISEQIRMYGMSEQTIEKQYINSLTAKLSGLEMVVAGILSDCQEMLEYGYSKEEIRQQLNRAKYVLFEMMDAKREKESA